MGFVRTEYVCSLRKTAWTGQHRVNFRLHIHLYGRKLTVRRGWPQQGAMSRLLPLLMRSPLTVTARFNRGEMYLQLMYMHQSSEDGQVLNLVRTLRTLDAPVIKSEWARSPILDLTSNRSPVLHVAVER